MILVECSRFAPDKLHRHIGNAVPMPVAEALGREVLRAWYKTKQDQGNVDGGPVQTESNDEQMDVD